MIELIIEFPLDELQTQGAKKQPFHITSSCCIICGKAIKEGQKTKSVQLLTNGNIVSSDQDFANSQGFFPVGSDCAKKLVINFAF